MWDGATHDGGGGWIDTVSGLELIINGTNYNWGDDFIRVNGADYPYTYLYTTSFNGNGFNGYTIQVVAKWYKTAID